MWIRHQARLLYQVKQYTLVLKLLNSMSPLHLPLEDQYLKGASLLKNSNPSISQQLEGRLLLETYLQSSSKQTPYFLTDRSQAKRFLMDSP